VQQLNTGHTAELSAKQIAGGATAIDAGLGTSVHVLFIICLCGVLRELEFGQSSISFAILILIGFCNGVSCGGLAHID
jgi:hypothetical protein